MSTPPPDPDALKALLRECHERVPGARDRLVAAVLDDLRAMARRRLEASRGRHDVLLQPTGLAIDVLLRLLDQQQPIQNRGHLMALAGRFLTRLLIDRERREGRSPIAGPLGDGSEHHPGVEVDVAELATVRDALRELEEFNPLAAHVLVLRGMSGCTIEEAADALGVGHATVERRWQVAKQWLAERLRSEKGPGGRLPQTP